MSLQGVLSDFGVCDIFQLIAQQRKTGILTIERKDRRLEVRFREGGVQRALPTESRPDAALAALLNRVGVVTEKDLAEAWAQQEETLESLPRVLVSTGLVEKSLIDEARRLLTDETIFELFLWDDGPSPERMANSPGAKRVSTRAWPGASAPTPPRCGP